MPSEIWKDVVGYEGLYQVSNFGRVKNSKRGTIKSFTPHNTNPKYLRVKLKNKRVFVHRVVAMAFISNPNNFPFVNHKDENPRNNCVDNLEWCTKEYNNNYGTRRERISKSLMGNKFAPRRSVIQINRYTNEDVAKYESIADAHRATGIDMSSIIRACVNIRQHFAGGYKWRYA